MEEHLLASEIFDKITQYIACFLPKYLACKKELQENPDFIFFHDQEKAQC